MSNQTIGSLFSGYGGLDMPLAGSALWGCEIAPAPRRVLAARLPGTVIHKDVTDLPRLEYVDVITGGSPCQDLSVAGGRVGMVGDSRSGLWSYQAAAIAEVQPRWALWENVRGALSGKAFTAADRSSYGGDVVLMRALGRVLADLHMAGYDAAWSTLRASDVGACHLRERVFVLARRRGSSDRLVLDCRFFPASSFSPTTARSTSHLPTPAVNDMGHGKDLAEYTSWRYRQKASDGTRAVHGRSLDVEVRTAAGEARMLPTPTVTTGNGGNSYSYSLDKEGRRTRYVNTLSGVATEVIGDDPSWGVYEEVITRAAEAVGRPAPVAVEPGVRRPLRVGRRFVEWMMMLPEGWVTDVAGVSYRQALTMLGNGVVPLQASAACAVLSGRAGRGEGDPWGVFDTRSDVWVTEDGPFTKSWPRSGSMVDGEVYSSPTALEGARHVCQ